MNDQSVLKNGANASASVTITFQKGEECENMDVDSGDDVRARQNGVMNVQDEFVWCCSLALLALWVSSCQRSCPRACLLALPHCCGGWFENL